jgi:hypothetical protein
MWRATPRACSLPVPAPKLAPASSRLGVLTGDTVELTENNLLPGEPEGYTQLQSALRNADAIPPHMTW